MKDDFPTASSSKEVSKEVSPLANAVAELLKQASHSELMTQRGDCGNASCCIHKLPMSHALLSYIWFATASNVLNNKFNTLLEMQTIYTLATRDLWVTLCMQHVAFSHSPISGRNKAKHRRLDLRMFRACPSFPTLSCISVLPSSSLHPRCPKDMLESKLATTSCYNL